MKSKRTAFTLVELLVVIAIQSDPNSQLTQGIERSIEEWKRQRACANLGGFAVDLLVPEHYSFLRANAFKIMSDALVA